jgi:hypothetical protein
MLTAEDITSIFVAVTEPGQVREKKTQMQNRALSARCSSLLFFNRPAIPYRPAIRMSRTADGERTELNWAGTSDGDSANTTIRHC